MALSPSLQGEGNVYFRIRHGILLYHTLLIMEKEIEKSLKITKIGDFKAFHSTRI